MRPSSKMLAKRGTTKSSNTKTEPAPTTRKQRRIDHRRDDVTAQFIAGSLEFGKPFENPAEAARGFTGAHHVDEEVREVERVERQRIRQRFAAFDGAQNFGDDEPKLRAGGELGGDGESAVERHARVEQRREFLSEEENVAAAISAERRQIDGERFLFFGAHVHGREALTAQFAGYQGGGIRRNGAGAEFAIDPDGAVVEGCGRPSELLRHASDFFRGSNTLLHFHPAIFAQLMHAVAASGVGEAAGIGACHY